RAARVWIPSRSRDIFRDAPGSRRGYCAARCELGLPRPAWPAVIVLAVLASYVVGSIPFGLLVARAATGQDVRAVGSGNIGATNVARAAGRMAATVTLALDALKGFLPAVLAERALL